MGNFPTAESIHPCMLCTNNEQLTEHAGHNEFEFTDDWRCEHVAESISSSCNPWFDRNVGRQAVIGEDGRTVWRSNADTTTLGAVVVGSAACRRFRLRIIDNSAPYRGALEFGFTTRAAARMPCPLPEQALCLPESWISGSGGALAVDGVTRSGETWLPGPESLQKGDLVDCTATPMGAMRIAVNDRTVAIWESAKLPKATSSRKLYPIASVFGKTVAVTLVETRLPPVNVQVPVIPPICLRKARCFDHEDPSRPSSPHSSAGGAESPRPAFVELRWHRMFVGGAAEIGVDGVTAKRTNSENGFREALVMADQPTRSFQFKVVENSGGWAGSVEFGFTTRQPLGERDAERPAMPSQAYRLQPPTWISGPCGFLYVDGRSTGQGWCTEQGPNGLRAGDVVECEALLGGAMRVLVNGLLVAYWAQANLVEEPLYGVVGMYGKCTAVELLGVGAASAELLREDLRGVVFEEHCTGGEDSVFFAGGASALPSPTPLRGTLISEGAYEGIVRGMRRLQTAFSRIATTDEFLESQYFTLCAGSAAKATASSNPLRPRRASKAHVIDVSLMQKHIDNFIDTWNEAETMFSISELARAAIYKVFQDQSDVLRGYVTDDRVNRLEDDKVTKQTSDGDKVLDVSRFFVALNSALRRDDDRYLLGLKPALDWMAYQIRNCKDSKESVVRFGGGTVYKGDGLPSKEELAKLLAAKGSRKVVRFKQFQSASTDKNLAERWADGFTWVITVPRGFSGAQLIHKCFHPFSNEKQVLFVAYSAFKVEEVTSSTCTLTACDPDIEVPPNRLRK